MPIPLRTIFLTFAVLTLFAMDVRAENGAAPSAVTSAPVQNDPDYWTEERMRNAKPMEKNLPDGSPPVPLPGAGTPMPGEPGSEPQATPGDDGQ